MELLSNDMMKVIKELELRESDEKILTDLLYNERLHKNQEWTTEAVNYTKQQIDALKVDEII